MTMTPEQATWFAGIARRIEANVETVLLGKSYVVRLGLTAMLSEGHLLLEDVPGVGREAHRLQHLGIGDQDPLVRGHLGRDARGVQPGQQAGGEQQRDDDAERAQWRAPVCRWRR